MFLKSIFIKVFLLLFGSKVFSKMLLQCDSSKTYRVFCREVYGRDLCQANMVDEEQLQKLIDVADLKRSDKVLDLGCGLGYTSEYINEVSGASVLGIDFASGAIDAATLRTSEKQKFLQFKYGNLNSLALTPAKFDCILSIDTLYFVNDLYKVIEELKDLLTPSGKILVFYSSRTEDENKRSPELNDLGKALTKMNFIYQTWNFTENERKVWELTKSVAISLKDDFKREGNNEILKGRIAEADKNLKWQKSGAMTRYLYCARLIPK